MALRSTLFVTACSAIVVRSSSRWAASSTGQAVGSRGMTSYRARRFIMDSSRPSSLAKAALRFSNSVCLRALHSSTHAFIAGIVHRLDVAIHSGVTIPYVVQQSALVNLMIEAQKVFASACGLALDTLG